MEFFSVMDKEVFAEHVMESGKYLEREKAHTQGIMLWTQFHVEACLVIPL